MNASTTFLAIALFLLPLNANAGAWSKDPESGCEVWNNQRGGTRTLKWSGTCLNGKANGSGTLDIYINGIHFGKYSGNFREGKRDGEGTLMWTSGSRYEGQWRDDDRSGNGVMTWSEGADGWRYEGQWRDDVRSGDGILTTTDKSYKFSGQWANDKMNGKGSITQSNGENYSGDFQNGKQHGHGIYTSRDGNRYEGAYVDGKRSGKGFETWPDGQRYTGDWRDGKKNGKGLVNFALGGTYEGDFVDGKANGYGVRIWTNGRRHEGMFKDDMLEGHGVSTWASGARFEGMYRDSYPNGFGTRTLPNGKKYSGQFVNGGNDEQERDEQEQEQTDGFQWGKAAALIGGAAIGGLGRLPSDVQVKVVEGILQDSLAGRQGMNGTQAAVAMASNARNNTATGAPKNQPIGTVVVAQAGPKVDANSPIYFAYVLRYPTASGRPSEPFCSTEGYGGSHGPLAKIAPLPDPPANLSWSVVTSQPVTKLQCETWANQCRARVSGSSC